MKKWRKCLECGNEDWVGETSELCFKCEIDSGEWDHNGGNRPDSDGTSDTVVTQG